MLFPRLDFVATGAFAAALGLIAYAGACAGEPNETTLVGTTESAQGGAGAAGTTPSSSSQGGSITFMQGPSGTGGATSVTSSTTGMMAEGGTAEPTYVFDKHFPGASQNDTLVVSDVAIDKLDGSVVLVGAFKGSRDFDGAGATNAANSAGNTDIFVVKYKQDGAYAWHKTYGNNEEQSANGVAIDATGRIALIGTFRGAFNMGGGTLDAVGFQFPDLYVAVLDKAGVHVASKSFGIGDPYSDFGNDVAFDKSGNVIVTGQYQSSISFGTTTLSAAGGLGDYDMFVAKLAVNGATFTELFAKSYGDTKLSEGLAIAVHTDDSIAVGGWTDGTVDFGNGALSGTADTEQALIAKLDGNGTALYAKVLKGGESRTRSVAFTPAGDVVLTGTFRSEIDLGAGAVKATGAANDIFIGRYDAMGKVAFDAKLGGSQSDDVSDVAVDPSGYPVVVGTFQGTLKINSMTSLTSMGIRDGLVAKVAPDDGHGYWGFGFGDAALQEATAVAIYPNGDTLFVGQYFGTVDFGGGPMTAPNSSQSFFIAKFGP